MAQQVKNLPAMRETWVRSLGWEDPLEKGKATHFCILAWRIPWIQFMGLQRIGHSLVNLTSLLITTFPMRERMVKTVSSSRYIPFSATHKG